MKNCHTFDSPSQLDRKLAEHIGSLLERDIEHRGRGALAVSGGKTPMGLFQQLSHVNINWSRVDITLVDERWVATDSVDSNEFLVRIQLLQNKARAAHFHGLKSAHTVPAIGLPEITLRLKSIPRPFSAVVLGMGLDGHTASWFPQSPELSALLDPDGSADLAATDPVTAPHLRITHTLSAVLNSREIIIHITGEDKKAVLESACERASPIAAVLGQSVTPVTIWWSPG